MHEKFMGRDTGVPTTPAEWFAELKSGELQPEMFRRYLDWCEANPQQAQEVARYQYIWNLMDFPPEDHEAGDAAGSMADQQDLAAPVGQKHESRVPGGIAPRSFTPRLVVDRSAALSRPTGARQQGRDAADAGMSAPGQLTAAGTHADSSAGADTSIARRSRLRRVAVTVTSALAASLVAVYLAAPQVFAPLLELGQSPQARFVNGGELRASSARGAQEFSTAVGQSKTLRLTDGSKIRLNTNTALEVHYQGAERLIRLKGGEATFDVAHDPNRPFVVEAGPGRIRALGTVFDVIAFDKSVTVAVIEGLVRVEQHGIQMAMPKVRLPQLSAGAQISYSDTGIISEVHSADLRRIENWQRGKLEFDSTPLAQAVTEVNRYSNIKVVIGDDRVNRIRVSGVFDIGDPSTFALGVTRVFPVEVIHQGQEIILISSRE